MRKQGYLFDSMGTIEVPEIECEQLDMIPPPDTTEELIIVESSNGTKYRTYCMQELNYFIELALQNKQTCKAYRKNQPDIIIAAVWQEASGSYYSYVEMDLITD